MEQADRPKVPRALKRTAIPALFTAVGVLIAFTAAYAAPVVVAGFEVDAHIQRQGAANDWATGPGGAGLLSETRNPDGSCTMNSTNPLLFCDAVKSDPTTFPGGAKESSPSGWVPIQSGQVTPKTDISNVYAYGTNDTSFTPPHPVIINGMERLPKAGSVHLDFEYNKQMTGTAPNQIPVRQPGDVLVAYDLGGARQSDESAITVRIFVANASGEYNYASPNFFGQGTGAVTGAGVTALLNSDTIQAGPWQSYDEHYNLVNTLPKFSFAEAAIDLTASVGLGSVCFNFLTVKSRASESVTSQLKDTTGPLTFPFCGGMTVKKYIDADESASITSGDVTGANVGNTNQVLKDWRFTVAGPSPSTTVICDGLTTQKGELVCSTVGNADTLTQLTPGTYTVTEKGQTTNFFNTDPGPLPKTGDVSKQVAVTLGGAVTVNFGNTCFIEHTFELTGAPTTLNKPFIAYVITAGPGSGATVYKIDLVQDSGTPTKYTAKTGAIFTMGNSLTWSYGINKGESGEQTVAVSGTVSMAGKGYPTCANSSTVAFARSTVSGLKFKDIDSDGVQDTDEPGLQGFTFQLKQNTTVLQTATSGVDGTYEFTNVNPGTYTVHEVKASEQTTPTSPPQGWKQTVPASDGDRTVVVTLGQDATVDKFGNTPLSRVVVTFTSLAKLVGGADATQATVVCKDSSNATLSSSTTGNTHTFSNLEIKQSDIVCTITITDP